jgi:type VII secretion effector (TIGR04197 family)
MADLRVEDATMVNAAAALHGAARRLSPVVRAVQAADTEVAGANTLATQLDAAGQAVTAVLEALGTAITALADGITQSGAGYAATDIALSREAGG